MTAFDTDVMTLILQGKPEYQQLLNAIPSAEQAIPVVVWEEVIRGRFNTVRQSEAKNARQTLVQAYALLYRSISDFRLLRILPYTTDADVLFRSWRASGVNVKSHDLRIAAICVAHDATLVSRNKRDFDKVSELKLSVWN